MRRCRVEWQLWGRRFRLVAAKLVLEEQKLWAESFVPVLLFKGFFYSPQHEPMVERK